MMALEKAAASFHALYGVNKTIWIAFSGGLDSHVLLFLYCRLKEGQQNMDVRAIHVNHGLHPLAAAWSLYCRRICQEYGIPLTEHSLHIKLKSGESLEECARKKRYALFQDLLGEGDLLLTAHHQDDQAETVLIQLLRGAGLKGLAAMPELKGLGAGYHGRPLLAFSRKNLQQYANDHYLRWIHDDSNDNTQWTRNFIRHELLPPLKTRWPTVANTLARSALHAAEAQDLLEEFAMEAIAKMQGSERNTLSIKQLNLLKPAKQRLILRTWIHALGYSLPNTKKLNAIQEGVLLAAEDRSPSVEWKQCMIRRYRDDLHLTASFNSHDKFSKVCWNLTDPLLLPGIGLLQAVKVQGKGLREDIQPVQVGFRLGGEILNIPSRGHHTVKNLLQEWGVPPWQRDRIPLIFFKEKLIGLVGFVISEEYAAKKNEMGYEVTLNESG